MNSYLSSEESINLSAKLSSNTFITPDSSFVTPIGTWMFWTVFVDWFTWDSAFSNLIVFAKFYEFPSKFVEF